MNQKTKFRFSVIAALMLLVVFVWSCNDDTKDSLDKLQSDRLAYQKDSLTRRFAYLKDSLLLRDSLSKLNQAGQVTYAIVVVNGSTTAVGNGRTQKTEGETGVAVTVSQFGKSSTVNTDASGVAVFTGFFRSAATVNVAKTGFTTVSMVVQVAGNLGTPNDKNYVAGQLVPIFETTGANTATISGKATIQSNLTNLTRELAPDGTAVTAMIDVDNGDLIGHYMGGYYGNQQGLAEYIYDQANNWIGWDPTAAFVLGYPVQVAYSGLATGTVTGGNYSLTVPASADPSWGLPIQLYYSEIGLDQTLFETITTTSGSNNVITTYRTLFGSQHNGNYLAPPAAGSVNVAFESFTGAAAATSVIQSSGELDRINVINGGSGFAVAPEVVVAPPGAANGVTATATATIANGTITGITITNPGSGYITAPGVTLLNGGGATATVALLDNGTVTGVNITTTGSGYAAAPTVTFSAPVAAGGTTATGTANIDAQGRVTSVTITSAGSLYNAAPTVTFSAAPAGGTSALGAALWSGRSIGNVNLTANGSDYLSAPTVTIGKPNLAGGTQATATAVYDAATRSVVAIQVTNQGTGYTSVPSITITANGSGASFQSFLKGGPVISANVSAQGSGYAYAPKVVFTGGNGTGAAADAIISNGKVVGINITSGGSGYTIAPTITLQSGSGAVATATVATDGTIGSITLLNGGSNYNGVPRVVITGTGGGALATATVNAAGAVSGLTLSAAGTGYVGGNTPSFTEYFGVTSGSYIYTQTGIKYVRDAHYGTGFRQPK